MLKVRQEKKSFKPIKVGLGRIQAPGRWKGVESLPSNCPTAFVFVLVLVFVFVGGAVPLILPAFLPTAPRQIQGIACLPPEPSLPPPSSIRAFQNRETQER